MVNMKTMRLLLIILLGLLFPLGGSSQSTWLGLETSVGRTRIPSTSSISNRNFQITNTYSFVLQRSLGRWFWLGGGIGLSHSPNRARLVITPPGFVGPSFESSTRTHVYYVDLRLQSILILWRDRSQGFLRVEGFGGPFILGTNSFRETTLKGEILNEGQITTFGNGNLYQYGLRLGLGTRYPLDGQWLIAPEMVTDYTYFFPGSGDSYGWRLGLQIGIFRKI